MFVRLDATVAESLQGLAVPGLTLAVLLASCSVVSTITDDRRRIGAGVLGRHREPRP